MSRHTHINLYTHTHTYILYICSCFTHSAPPEPGMTAVFCLVKFQISSVFHKVLSLTSFLSCLLLSVQELSLYGLISVLISAKGFRFRMI